MKTLMALLIFISIKGVQATVDYKATALTRTYPMAFFLAGTAGYGYKFWDKSEKDKALYGYIRPNATFQTSAVVNSLRAQIDLFPISFFGFYVGFSKTMRNFDDMDSFDCTKIICRANLSRNYFGSKFALAYNDFFFMNDLRKITTNLDNKTGAVFADELSTIELRGNKDYINYHQMVFGSKITDKYSLAALWHYNKSKYSQQRTIMKVLLNKYDFNKKWTFAAGPGLWHSRHGHNLFTIIATVTWNGDKGVTLF